jgi:hypothetical protein
VIVSFNGKSFDWPLLRTRFILQRLRAPALPGHLDLLHCARRIYKRRLGSVRLIELEQSLLGFERCDDLPGELIPETYLGFLRGRSPAAALWPIVDHNRSDLVALPALLGRLGHGFAASSEADATSVLRCDASDQLGFAQVAARAQDRGRAGEHNRALRQRALAFAEAAVAADLRGELAAEAMHLTGMLRLQDGDHAGAQLAFDRCIASAGGRHDLSARAHLALAKLFEHKFKDLNRAAMHAQHTGPAEGAQACARRIQRLQRKTRCSLD